MNQNQYNQFQQNPRIQNSQNSNQYPQQNQFNPAIPLGGSGQSMQVFGDFDKTSEATLPFEKVVNYSHTFVVDSRQRDCEMYPSPNYYRIELPTTYRNITSIELQGSVIPRSSYNVHNVNKYIDFSIGSSLTSINIKNGGTGYTVLDTITISSPLSGVQATATINSVNSFGAITSILIGVAGTGYFASKLPSVSVISRTGTGADLYAVVGTQYTAELRVGQYTIGGNPTPPGTVCSGLVQEIQDAMNYAVNGSPYVHGSTSPFAVRLVNQYPELSATVGTPEYYNTNATLFNRIQITNVNSDPWELLFCSGSHNRCNASTVMGFDNIDYYTPTTTLAVNNGSGVLIPAGTTLRASNDYCLTDDPKYVLLSFWEGSESFERIESTDQSIDRKFGTMIFDANLNDVVTDTIGTGTYTSGGLSYLVGPVLKGEFWSPPGILKPIRGFDFDQKKLEFMPPKGKLSALYIRFTTFSGTTSNAEQNLYDFANRNHLLVFNVKANDNKSGRR